MFKRENFYALLMHALDKISKIEQSNEDIIHDLQKSYDDIPFNIFKYIDEPS